MCSLSCVAIRSTSSVQVQGISGIHCEWAKQVGGSVSERGTVVSDDETPVPFGEMPMSQCFKWQLSIRKSSGI